MVQFPSVSTTVYGSLFTTLKKIKSHKVVGRNSQLFKSDLRNSLFIIELFSFIELFVAMELPNVLLTD